MADEDTLCACGHAAAVHGHESDLDLTPECKIDGCECKSFALPADFRAEIAEVLTGVAALLGTSQRQAKAISTWEEIWTVRLPECATALAEIVAALEEIDGPIEPAEAEEMAAVLLRTKGLIEEVGSMAPPDPNLIILYYLRRLERRLDDYGSL